jgi:hypothetical protein
VVATVVFPEAKVSTRNKFLIAELEPTESTLSDPSAPNLAAIGASEFAPSFATLKSAVAELATNVLLNAVVESVLPVANITLR